jgi:hypothetical protein
MSVGKLYSRSIQAAALTAALASLAACAGGPKGPPAGAVRPVGARGMDVPSVITRPGALLLAGLDANGDFAISKQEAETGADKQFVHADANGDGLVAPLEFAAWANSALGTSDSTPGRLSFDTSSDGQITQAEFIAGVRALFAQFDADQDGQVARSEMVQQLKLPDREGPMMGGGPMMGRRGGPPGGPGQVKTPEGVAG